VFLPYLAPVPRTFGAQAISVRAWASLVGEWEKWLGIMNYGRFCRKWRGHVLNYSVLSWGTQENGNTSIRPLYDPRPSSANAWNAAFGPLRSPLIAKVLWHRAAHHVTYSSYRLIKKRLWTGRRKVLNDHQVAHMPHMCLHILSP